MPLKIFKGLFGGEKSGNKEKTYTPIINPFLTSVYLGVDDLEVNQLVDGLTYYRERNPKIFDKIKETLKGLMSLDDINNLDKLDEEMNMLDFFTIAMEYIQDRHPEKKKEIDQYLKKNGLKQDPSYYVNKIADVYKNVDLEFLIIKVNSLLDVPGKNRDGFINYLTVERKDIAKLVYSKDLKKDERIKYYNKLEKLMETAKDDCNSSKELFSVQRLLLEIGQIVENMESSNIKPLLEKRLELTDNIYLYWKRIDFEIQGNIKQDKKDIEFYKNSGFDLNIEVPTPILTNIELSNKVLDELRVLNNKKSDLEKMFE